VIAVAVEAPSVTFVAPYGLLGGSERYLELLLEGLPRERIREIVLLQHGPFEERLRDLGYAPVVLPTSPRSWAILAGARRLRSILRSTRPDLVHANGIKAAVVSLLATRGMGIPVVWVKHDLSYDGPVARAVALGCRLVVAPSAAAAQTFGRRTRARTSVVHYGVPTPEIDRAAARELVLEVLGLPADALVVVLVGRIHPVKGHLEVVEIADNVRQEAARAHFVFLGGADPSVPHYAAAVRNRIDQLGLAEVISALGHRADARTFVAGCDVLVMPSGPDERGMGREVLPFAGLEAMAAGIPAVAYADGGVPELFGECALLVPPGDRAALRASLLRLLEDVVVRERLGRCGYERVRERFSVEGMRNETLACYRKSLR
jgi:glycosyltransferase involved in cell wall biosynthesis